VVPLDRVIYSADVGYQKRDRRFFEVASEQLGLTVPERPSVVFVDDVMNDVEVARSAGWRAVRASTDQPWHREVGDLLGLRPWSRHGERVANWTIASAVEVAVRPTSGPDESELERRESWHLPRGRVQSTGTVMQ
jgi:FMN phosphatase YigB (HAD superfamily)